jgi:hypothetical protein
MNLETIRTWQYQKMENALKAIESIFSSADPDDLTTYRDGGDGWTAVEVLGHLRDFEAVFFERAQVTVSEDNPPLKFPDPDDLAKTNDYNNRLWPTLLAEWKTDRAAHIEFLKSRAESDWERIAQHPRRGSITLHDQLFLTPWHDTLHIEQITRILAEKKR